MESYLNCDNSSHTKKDEMNWKWNLQVRILQFMDR